MPSSETLTSFLKDRKKETQLDEETKTDWNKVKNDWLADIQRLFDSIRDWLSGAAAEKLVEFQSGSVEIREDRLGIYNAPTLTLDLGDQAVHFVPAFRLTYGTQGRINVLCGARKWMLIRSGDKEWNIGFRAPGPGELRLIPLTEDSFRDLLEGMTR